MIDLLAQGGMGDGMFLAVIAAFVVMMFMQSRNAKKQQKQFKEWVDGLKTKEQIVTKAGVYGTITSVQDDSVVICIDKENNTKMKISKDSISHAQVDTKDKKEESEKKS